MIKKFPYRVQFPACVDGQGIHLLREIDRDEENVGSRDREENIFGGGKFYGHHPGYNFMLSQGGECH